MILIASCVLILIIVIAFFLGTFLCYACATVVLCGSGKQTITGGLDNLDFVLDKLIKSHKKYPNKYDPYEYLKKYGEKDKSTEILTDTDFYRTMAKKIYEENGKSYEFLNNIKRHEYNYMKESKKFSTQVIKKYMTKRELSNGYPQLFTKLPYDDMGINYIEYTPREGIDLNEMINTIIKNIITMDARELTKEEIDESMKIIKDFADGKLTESEFTLNMKDGTKKKTKTCEDKSLKDTRHFKPFHWGQRKLLLSEIDMFNRIANDISHKKFKNEKISVVYPGSAVGNHLIILMEMYPNLVFYLWDPAKYNTILYLVEFMRRNLKIPNKFRYKKSDMDMAKKYKGRVFINMDLSDEEFLTYHKNATTKNIVKNYDTQHGFFLEKSAQAFSDYRESANDKSIIAFVSDIRLYKNHEIKYFIPFNRLKEKTDPVLTAIIEKLNKKDYDNDMEIQRDWFSWINADYGLFKFKIKTTKYVEKDIQEEYLDGDIILQAWAPMKSIETRLFVKPKRKSTAYYNIVNYGNSLTYFNGILRLHNFKNTKLKELGINIDATMADIWSPFLPLNKVGMDAILETYILYDYIKIHKKEVAKEDLIMMISDITQTLLNMNDHGKILEYLKDKYDFQKIMKHREKYHKKFNSRLDFSAYKYDYRYCSI